MQIHLRNSGDRNAAVIIPNVLYFEQLPSIVQFTVAGEDQTSFMDVDENGDYSYNGKTYDFCQVYS